MIPTDESMVILIKYVCLMEASRMDRCMESLLSEAANRRT
jgi:hypothetical protein